MTLKCPYYNIIHFLFNIIICLQNSIFYALFMTVDINLNNEIFCLFIFIITPSPQYNATLQPL